MVNRHSSHSRLVQICSGESGHLLMQVRNWASKGENGAFLLHGNSLNISTEAAEREVLAHKFCLKSLSNAVEVLRSSPVHAQLVHSSALSSRSVVWKSKLCLKSAGTQSLTVVLLYLNLLLLRKYCVYPRRFKGWAGIKWMKTTVVLQSNRLHSWL